MSQHATWIGAMALVVSLVSQPAAAQGGAQWRGSGGWGATTAYGRMYDPGKVETIRGQVVRVERFVPMQGMSAGIHLILRADKEEIPVHLGPAWYVERQDVKIEAGATVEIEGSRVNVAGTPAIIAAVVKRGDEVLRLRDQAGIPAWSGWRRR